MCSKINFCYDIHSFAKKDQCELELNDIASVEIKALKPIAVEPYADNRFLGSFILIDEISFNTVAAGMIRNIK
jgi:sulfate adenylyltransferase subunit 1 (EFTu-like GTPase family)